MANSVTSTTKNWQKIPVNKTILLIIFYKKLLEPKQFEATLLSEIKNN